LLIGGTMNRHLLAFAGLSLLAGCGASKSEAADDDDSAGAGGSMSSGATGGSSTGGTGGSMSSGGTGGSPTAQMPDTPTFVQGFCKAFSACCAEAGLRSDGAQCTVLLLSIVSGQAYDAEAAGTCMAWLESASHGGTVCPDYDSAPVACAGVLASSGTKTPGEACASDDECAPSAEGSVNCATGYSGSMTLMQCQVQVMGTLGSAPCVGTRDGNVIYFDGNVEGVPAKGYICDRADGLRCDGTACAAISGIGDYCTSSSDCADGAYCDYAASTCAALRPVGAACEQFSDECAEGAYCSAATLTCTAGLPAGAACTDSETCRSTSCVNGACLGDEPADLGLLLICGQ
jgi:hypothetical protein